MENYWDELKGGCRKENKELYFMDSILPGWTWTEWMDVLSPGTAVIRRRRQSMKRQVEVKSMNRRLAPIALRAAAKAAKAAYSST